MERPVRGIPTAWLLSSVFKRGIKTHQFVNKNAISDFPSVDKFRKQRKYVFIFIHCAWNVL
jgi:hypothetical protein